MHVSLFFYFFLGLLFAEGGMLLSLFGLGILADLENPNGIPFLIAGLGAIGCGVFRLWHAYIHEISLTRKAAFWYYLAGIFGSPLLFTLCGFNYRNFVGSGSLFHYLFWLVGLFVLLGLLMQAIDYKKLPKRESVLRKGPLGLYNPKYRSRRKMRRAPNRWASERRI